VFEEMLETRANFRMVSDENLEAFARDFDLKVFVEF
jgi:hypothetical protein